jgi:hypothetical protein
VIGMGRPTRLVPLILLLGMLLAACSSGKPTRVVTITTTPTTPAGAGTGSVTSKPSHPVTRRTKLSGTCESLLPDYTVTQALGRGPISGTDAFVVGKPEPDIGRIGYLNCRYGVTGKGASATPKIEIGISLYATPAKAAVRIPATVDDYTAHGATATDTTVGGHPAKLVTGGAGAGYDVPLLVVASGQRTVAVSISTAVATGAAVAGDARKLAALALRRTGG